jgi:probable HAF family extracellular repeat protein
MRRLSFILFALLFASIVVGQQISTTPASPPCYAITNLGEYYLDEGSDQSLGLNLFGTVVGTTNRWNPLPLPFQGYVYQRGVFKQLPTLWGQSVDPRQINIRGQIAGGTQLPDGLWHATLWDEGKPIDLPTLGGASSFAVALNDEGDAAGNSSVVSLYDFHAAAWFNRKVVNLSLDGELQSYANGINDERQVTVITEYPDQTWHSFIWKNGACTEVPPQTNGGLFVGPINNAGKVCGQGALLTGWHAFIYDGKELVDLDPTSQWAWSGCSGLNLEGHAVGLIGDNEGNTHAFLWRNAKEGMIDLNTTIPADSGVYLIFADSINLLDQITAPGYVNGELDAFLLTPTRCKSQ